MIRALIAAGLSFTWSASYCQTSTTQLSTWYIKAIEKARSDTIRGYVFLVPAVARRLRQHLNEAEHAMEAGDAERRELSRRKFALTAASLARRREEVYRAGITNLTSLTAEQRAIWDVARGVVDRGGMSTDPELVLSQNPQEVLTGVEAEAEAILQIPHAQHTNGTAKGRD